MKIETVRMSIKKKRALEDDNIIAFATYDPITKVHTITIPYKASTKTRLHELAHCELGHCLSPVFNMLISDYIAEELEAEKWAYERFGTELSIEAIFNIAHQAVMFGARSSHVFNSSIRALHNHNFKLTKEQRSYLWHSCKEFELERKEA